MDETYMPQLGDNDWDYQPFFGTEGMPQMGGGLGFAVSTGLGIGGQMAMAPLGMMPMGMNDTNLYDRIQRRELTQMHDSLMREAAKQGKESTIEVIKGGFALHGTPYGADQQKAAEASADQLSAFAPMLAMMAPKLMDELGGDRGRVEAMQEQMFRGAQFRIDPVSGQMGMSEDSMKGVFKQVYQNMYAGDKYLEREGIKAGEMGDLFTSLQRRGMMAPPGQVADLAEEESPDGLIQGMRTNNIDLPDSVKNYAKGDKLNEAQRKELKESVRKLSPDQTQALGQDLDVAPALERFDAKKIEVTLKKYQGAVSAMRDIFGGAGRPNAPMSELIEGLQQLTGGAMQQMDPAAVENMVRTTQATAMRTGIGIEGAMMIQQKYMAQAEAMGINPIMATQATQHEMSMRGTYGAMGYGAAPAWGAWDDRKFASESGKAMLRSTQAMSTQQMATAVRMQETYNMGDEFFKQDAAGKKLKAYTEAIKTGQTSFVDPTTGKQQSVLMSNADFMGLMQQGSAAPINQGQITRYMSERDANQEVIARKPGLSQINRRLQGEELLQRGSRATSLVLGEQFYGLTEGKTDAERERLGLGSRRAMMDQGAAASRAALDAYMSMDEADKGDNDKRRAAMGKALRVQLESTEAGRALLAKQGDAKGQDAWLRGQSEQIFQEANEDPVLKRAGGMINVSREHSAKALDRDVRDRAADAAMANVRKSFGGLGRGGLVQKAMQALQDVDPSDPDSVRRAVAQTLGGENSERIASVLKDDLVQMKQYSTRAKDLEDMAKAAEGTDPAKAKSLRAEAAAMRQGIDDARAKVQKNLQSTEAVKADDAKRKDTIEKIQKGDLKGLNKGLQAEIHQVAVDREFKTDEEAAKWVLSHVLPNEKGELKPLEAPAPKAGSDEAKAQRKSDEAILQRAAQRIGEGRPHMEGGREMNAEDVRKGVESGEFGGPTEDEGTIHRIFDTHTAHLSKEEMAAAKRLSSPVTVDRESTKKEREDSGPADGSAKGTGGGRMVFQVMEFRVNGENWGKGEGHGEPAPTSDGRNKP